MARLTPKRFLNPLGLFFLLTSIYLLTYSGLFRSVDELVLWNMVDRFTQGRPLEPLPLQLAIFHDLHNGVMRRQGWVLICCWLISPPRPSPGTVGSRGDLTACAPWGSINGLGVTRVRCVL